MSHSIAHSKHDSINACLVVVGGRFIIGSCLETQIPGRGVDLKKIHVIPTVDRIIQVIPIGIIGSHTQDMRLILGMSMMVDAMNVDQSGVIVSECDSRGGVGH